MPIVFYDIWLAQTSCPIFLKLSSFPICKGQDKITQQENVVKANFQALTARVNGTTKLQEVSQSNLERLVPSATVSLGNLRFKTTVNGYGWTSTQDLGWAFLSMWKSYGMAFCLPSCFTMVSFDSFSRRSQRSTAWFQGWEFRMLLKEITHFFFLSIYFLSLPVSFVCFLRKWHWFLFFFFVLFSEFTKWCGSESRDIYSGSS